ncbi:hypothetical protein Taro_037800 [Colocasia esculenta]|uniref:Uncharacterized protein n=1 Tax=Colocasia esculenta TaxID=4460 RepID=A0A843WLT2_COLES|nr:hypothetical protein [Colocasia esculenta]
MRAVCRALVERADVDRTELSQALLGQGRFCPSIFGRFELVGLGWTCSRREDRVWSGRNAGLSPV